MNRYRTSGANDDPPLVAGDDALLGVNEYDGIENIPPGQVQSAVNMDFSSQDAKTRGGFVCIPSLGTVPFDAGTTWTARSMGSTSANYRSVCYGNGRFVTVNTAFTGVNDVAYSTDGVTWNLVSTGVSASWMAIGFGNGRFVAIGSSAELIYSSDGVNWTHGSNVPLYGGWFSIAYGDGKFVAVGDQSVDQQSAIYSTDGISWTIGVTPVNSSDYSSVCYGNGRFVAVATSNQGSGYSMASTDGINWTSNPSGAPIQVSRLEGVTYGKGIFVAVSNDTVVTSTDGLTWTWVHDPVTNPVPQQDWYAVSYAANLFVAVSDEGASVTDQIMFSTNGVNWTATDAPVIAPWKGITYGAGTFVAVPSYIVPGADYAMTYGSSTGVGNVFGTAVYSDPNDAGSQWIMLLGRTSVLFTAFGKQARTVSLGSYSVDELSTLVQCNNQVYLFRGSSLTPLVWDGDWSGSFDAPPTVTPGAGFSTIPYSNQATYYQNRLWVIDGKDQVAASDVLDFTVYDDLANNFNLNTGSSDYLVMTYPFGENSLLVFKNRSIYLLQNVQGSLDDVTVTEVTRQVGAIGINAVVSVGPDVVYMSDQNINLITLTATNNAVQHKTLPLSRNIRKVLNRVNWQYAYKVSMAYYDNKLFVSLPLDNSVYCNAVVVYNFVTENWYGEWNFSSDINMSILGWAVVGYLGLQRLHAVTEDGRIFVTDEGANDISGTTVAEISTSLTTRAYSFEGQNAYQRRMWIDLATNRPSFSVLSYSEGASEESEILTDQTFSRSDSWIFSDSTYDLTNVNDDFNRAYRKDYSTGPDSVQCGTGFQPEMPQEFRLPIDTRRQGRLAWAKITNSQGFIQIMSIGFEARPGARSSLIQV
jgi:hypothetical protein